MIQQNEYGASTSKINGDDSSRQPKDLPPSTSSLAIVSNYLIFLFILLVFFFF